MFGRERDERETRPVDRLHLGRNHFPFAPTFCFLDTWCVI